MAHQTKPVYIQYLNFPAFLPGIYTLLLLCLLLLPATAKATALQGIRSQDSAEGQTRLVLETEGQPGYAVFTLTSPPRLVVDITNGTFREDAPPTVTSSRIGAVRYAQKSADTLRIVFDMAGDTTLKKHFILWPEEKAQSFRLVIDLQVNSAIPSAILREITPSLRPGAEAAIATIEDTSAPQPALRPETRRNPVIILDAGHGGHDPGTIGRKRTKEKNITLEYAKALAEALRDTGRYTVHLSGSRDEFLPLQERVQRAQQYKGDMFISLHANSHGNPSVKGFSVYTLSERASDKEAAALANRENKAGILPSMDLQEEDQTIINILVDIAQRDTMNLSASFAESLVDNLHGNAYLLSNPHRFAGFRVLTAPDIPSVLIELGFLSNPREEQLLNSNNYKKRLVANLVDAIDDHFKKHEVD